MIDILSQIGYLVLPFYLTQDIWKQGRHLTGAQGYILDPLAGSPAIEIGNYAS